MDGNQQQMKDELDCLTRNYKVMRMQHLLSTELRKHLAIRISYGSIKNYIPEFCEGIVEYENFDDFKDLTLGDLLPTWKIVCNMKLVELESLMTMTNNKIIEIQYSLDQVAAGKDIPNPPE